MVPPPARSVDAFLAEDDSAGRPAAVDAVSEATEA